MKGKKHTEKAKRKIGEASKRRIPWSKGLKGLNLGNKNPFYGRTHTKEVKERLSKLFKGKRFSPNTEFKKGMSPESHPHWMGGISFAPYGLEFNEEKKERVRGRDQYCCQQCLRSQDELFTKLGRKYKLSIHHIDYNKKNNLLSNLISLCRVCHAQTNFKRKNWTDYFRHKLQYGNISN